MPESKEVLRCPGKIIPDQGKERKHTRDLTYGVGEGGSHKTGHLLSCISVKGLAF